MVHPVIPGKLFRAARPGYSATQTSRVGMGEVQSWIEVAQSFGVASIICLLDDEHLGLYPDGDLLGIYRTAGFEVAHLPTRDHLIPPLTPDQLSAVLQFYRNLPKPVVVHCSAGLGRTGVAWAHIVEHEK